MKKDKKKRILVVKNCGQKDEGIYSVKCQEHSSKAKLYVSRKSHHPFH